MEVEQIATSDSELEHIENIIFLNAKIKGAYHAYIEKTDLVDSSVLNNEDIFMDALRYIFSENIKLAGNTTDDEKAYSIALIQYGIYEIFKTPPNRRIRRQKQDLLEFALDRSRKSQLKKKQIVSFFLSSLTQVSLDATNDPHPNAFINILTANVVKWMGVFNDAASVGIICIPNITRFIANHLKIQQLWVPFITCRRLHALHKKVIEYANKNKKACLFTEYSLDDLYTPDIDSKEGKQIRLYKGLEYMEQNQDVLREKIDSISIALADKKHTPETIQSFINDQIDTENFSILMNMCQFVGPIFSHIFLMCSVISLDPYFLIHSENINAVETDILENMVIECHEEDPCCVGRQIFTSTTNIICVAFMFKSIPTRLKAKLEGIKKDLIKEIQWIKNKQAIIDKKLLEIKQNILEFTGHDSSPRTLEESRMIIMNLLQKYNSPTLPVEVKDKINIAIRLANKKQKLKVSIVKRTKKLDSISHIVSTLDTANGISEVQRQCLLSYIQEYAHTLKITLPDIRTSFSDSVTTDTLSRNALSINGNYRLPSNGRTVKIIEYCQKLDDNPTFNLFTSIQHYAGVICEITSSRRMRLLLSIYTVFMLWFIVFIYIPQELTIF
ncbi:hypothetical protein NEIRO03_0183 [Nematocida sp. AWRm78]|nr:hypothetical protein NEIRO02_0184 [Nematocida sp. AWRm79]KAI5182519.1 hypothetical protein NEIRO03_0183 [Nematocida sp. AWRm78]